LKDWSFGGREPLRAPPSRLTVADAETKQALSLSFTASRGKPTIYGRGNFSFLISSEPSWRAWGFEAAI